MKHWFDKKVNSIVPTKIKDGSYRNCCWIVSENKNIDGTKKNVKNKRYKIIKDKL